MSAFYNGNFWTGHPQNNYIESDDNPWGDGWKTYKHYNTPDVTPGPVNNAAILVGVADMGFRLTYRTNYQFFNKKDVFVGGNTLYKSYRADEGYIIPQIAWSMTKDLTKFGIKPYVTADLDFHRDSLKFDAYFSKSESSGEMIATSQNYFQPKITFGLGGVTFYNKDGFRGVIDLDNEFNFTVYNNDYTYTDNTGKPKTAKIKGLNNNDTLTTNSNVWDVVTPSVAGSWSSGNVGLRAKLNLPMTITGTEVTEMYDKQDGKGTLGKSGNRETSTFAFQPDLRLALSWRVFPKFALYAGGQIRTTPLSLSTITTKSYDGQDKEVEHSTTKTKNNNFSGTFTNNLRLGTTFNISDNVWVEAQTGLWNSDGKASVFGTTNGLFEFSSILVGLKF